MRFKRIIAAALAVCVVGGAMPQFPAFFRETEISAADSFERINGVKYYVDNYGSHARIDQWTVGDVTILSSYKDKPVTSILFECRMTDIQLYSITLPDTITTIGNLFDLYTCKTLHGIYINNSTSYKSENGILYRINSEGEKVEILCYPCASYVRTFTLPKTVTDVGNLAGIPCLLSNLNEFKVEEGSEHFCAIDGILYSTNDNGDPETLVRCPSKRFMDLTVPDTVTTIGSYSFAYVVFKNVLGGDPTEIVLPDSVSKIEIGAFHYIDIYNDSPLRKVRIRIKFLNPDCNIASGTISISDALDFSIDVYGYDDSTAEFYANRLRENGRFFSLGDDLFTVEAAPESEEQGTVIGAGRVGEGQIRKLKAVPNTGFAFMYWKDSKDNLYYDDTLEISKKGSYTAYFQAITPTITANSIDTEQGTVTGGGESLDYGTELELTATPTENYLFDHWTDSKGNIYTSNPLTVIAQRDETYTAVFKNNLFNINAGTSVGGTVTGSGDHLGGTTATLEATPDENYVFNYWTDNRGVKYYDNPMTFTVDGDVKLTANFKLASYDVNVDYDRSMGDVFGAGEHQYDSICSLVAKAKEGYSFVGFEGINADDTIAETEGTVKFRVKGITDVVAVFRANKYAVDIQGAMYGSAEITEGTPDEITGAYTCGSTIKVTATPDTNYKIAYWEVNGVALTDQTKTTLVYTVGTKNQIKPVFKKNKDSEITVPDPVTISGIEYTFSKFGWANVTAIDPELEFVTIPAEVEGFPVTSIDENAFAENSAAKALILSKNYRSFFPEMSKNCPKLANVYIAEENPYFKDIDGVVYTADGKCLAYYPPAHGSSYTIPDGVETVHGFSYSGIEEVIFPESVKTIGGFDHCNGLTQAIIPEGVQYLRYQAFLGCENIEEVYLPKSLIEIEDEVFTDNTKLTKVTIDTPLDEYGESPFKCDLNYSRAPFSNGVDDEGHDVFTGTIYAPEGGAGEEIVKLIKECLDITVNIETIETVLIGDVDNSGTVDLADATLLARYVAGWDVTIDLTTADINKDGAVTKVDSVILSRYIAGWDGYDTYFA